MKAAFQLLGLFAVQFAVWVCLALGLFLLYFAAAVPYAPAQGRTLHTFQAIFWLIYVGAPAAATWVGWKVGGHLGAASGPRVALIFGLFIIGLLSVWLLPALSLFNDCTLEVSFPFQNADCNG